MPKLTLSVFGVQLRQFLMELDSVLINAYIQNLSCIVAFCRLVVTLVVEVEHSSTGTAEALSLIEGEYIGE